MRLRKISRLPIFANEIHEPLKDFLADLRAANGAALPELLLPEREAWIDASSANGRDRSCKTADDQQQ